MGGGVHSREWNGADDETINVSDIDHARIISCFKLKKVETSGYVCSVDLRDCSSLAKFEVHGELTHLFLYASLVDLKIDNCALTTLKLSCPSLTHLSCRCNKLRKVDLTLCSSLKIIDLGFNRLVTLSVPPSCKDLNVEFNRLFTLILHCPSLEKLNVRNNRFASLHLLSCPSLSRLDVRGNEIRGLTLRSHRRLKKVLSCWCTPYILLPRNSKALRVSEDRNCPRCEDRFWCW